MVKLIGFWLLGISSDRVWVSFYNFRAGSSWLNQARSICNKPAQHQLYYMIVNYDWFPTAWCKNCGLLLDIYTCNWTWQNWLELTIDPTCNPNLTWKNDSKSTLKPNRSDPKSKPTRMWFDLKLDIQITRTEATRPDLHRKLNQPESK